MAPAHKIESTLTISEMNRLAPKTYFTTVGLQEANHSVFCSGVLIDADSVLTAAHCLCNKVASYIFIGDTVFAGDTLAPDNKTISMSIPVKQGPVFLNADFCPSLEKWHADGGANLFPSDDLAILHLEEPIPPVMVEYGLPAEPIANGEPAPFIYGVGFGRADGIDLAGKKHRARFKFATRLCAEAEAAKLGCRPGEESVTVNYETGTGQDSCFGDSGGPIFIREIADHPVPTSGFMSPPQLVAITSRGLSSNAEGFCGEGAINTSLERPEVQAWINSSR